MEQNNNTAVLNPQVSAAAAKPAKQPKPAKADKAKADKGRHVLASVETYVKDGVTYLDLSAFGLSDAVKIAGPNVILPTGGGTVAKSLKPKIDRLSKVADLEYAFEDAQLDSELTQAAAIALAAMLFAAPKSHAKPAGTKGNSRKDRVIAIRTQQMGAHLRA